MKQTIAIINANAAINYNDTLNGCGGSETWAIEMANQFSKHGFNVLLFSPNCAWVNMIGIQYIPLNLLDFILSYTKVDYFFLSRYFYSNELNIISKYSLNKNLYIIAHDLAIMLDGNDITQEIIDNNEVLSKHLQKICVMSEYGAYALTTVYSNISEKYMLITGNGINSEFIKPLNCARDNNLFWSSRWERGLELLTYSILPLLKQYFPDMKIYVAQYENELPDNLRNHEDIIFLGKLNKEELYNEMQKHKVCFYPNIYEETFCITILEAILCDMELITVDKHGPHTTLKLFSHMLLNQYINFNNQDILNKIALLIKNRMDNYYKPDRITIRKIMKNYILNTYSWENIYNIFNLNIFHKYE